MRNMKKRYMVLIIILLSIFAFSIYYVNDYYHANSSALTFLNGSDNVSVVKTSQGLLLDGPGNETALIFYPGGKVEYTSYLPLMNNIASRGVDCYLVEMPFNIAFLGANSAENIINNSNYSRYVLAGHSLGGIVASNYVHEHNVSGLILLASYPTNNINVPTLSVYGSSDKVLNLTDYNNAKPLYKANFTELIINGGNHAQFGNYGNQSGDGIANITSNDQQNQTANAIINFILSLNI